MTGEIPPKRETNWSRVAAESAYIEGWRTAIGAEEMDALAERTAKRQFERYWERNWSGQIPESADYER